MAAAQTDSGIDLDPMGTATVTSVTQIGEQRISRTIYRYTFRVTVASEQALAGVSARLTAVGAGSSIVDGNALVGDLEAQVPATPNDTITIQHDRTLPFDVSALRWDVVGRIPLYRQRVFNKASTLADIVRGENGGRFVSRQLIVVFEPGTAVSFVTQLAAKYNAAIVGRIPEAQSFQFELMGVSNEAELTRIQASVAGEPGVTTVTLNYVADVSALTVPEDPGYHDSKWATNKINAELAWDRFKSEPGKLTATTIKVGVIDTGFEKSHPDLHITESISPSGELNGDIAPLVDPEDPGYESHGMHVAGIIGAKANKVGTVGVAAVVNPQLYVAKKDSMFADMANFARLVRAGVKVLNLSFGYKTAADALAAAPSWGNLIQVLAQRNDFLAIFAAGNKPNVSAFHQGLVGRLFDETWSDYDKFAVARDHILIVGALNGNGDFAAEYSAFGRAVQIVAPGGGSPCSKNSPAPESGEIGYFWQNRPADWANRCDPSLGLNSPALTIANRGVRSLSMRNGTMLNGGTSMAAPFVAGAAATVWSAFPTLKAYQIKSALIDPKDRGTVKDSSGRIYPILDVNGSLDAARVLFKDPSIDLMSWKNESPATAVIISRVQCVYDGGESIVAGAHAEIYPSTNPDAVIAGSSSTTNDWGVHIASVPFSSVSTHRTTKFYLFVASRENLNPPINVGFIFPTEWTGSQVVSLDIRIKSKTKSGCGGSDVDRVDAEPSGLEVSSVSSARGDATSNNTLNEPFDGASLDLTKWNIDGWEGTGNDYTRGLGRGIGPVTINNGLVEFGRLGRISTKNKVTFSGDNTIVIEGRTASTGALHDTSVMLVDTTSGDQFLMGDTNYGGWGFYAIGIGSYKLKEASTIGDPTDPLTLGSSTTEFMEYRLTITGDKIKIERGPTLANITQTGTGTLGRSIVGRTFHVSIGAAWAYYPATWDWIRVKADPGPPSAGLVGHWSFDSCDGRDSGPNALNGSVSGAPVCVDGRKGKALRFNGSSDWITVPTSGAMPSTAVTMSYWLHREGVAPRTPLENYISKELSFQAYMRPTSTTEFGVWLGSPGFWTGWGGPATVLPTANDWVHYAFTYDNASKRADTYVNGALVHSVLETNANAVVRVSNRLMFIGRNGSANVYHIKGLLDDVRIYNRALTAEEVRVLAR